MRFAERRAGYCLLPIHGSHGLLLVGTSAMAEVDTSVPNIVTAVLASYRGYDTLGETTVIFTAGIAVMALLWRWRTERS